MKIATWNVNSIRARLPRVLAWLKAALPDVALLQETKVTDEQFPAEPLEDLGYNLTLVGEAGRNGVAILAKSPLEDLRRTLPGDDEDHEARYVEGVVRGVRVASVYVPNGTALGSPRFAFKLAFFDRLRAHAEELLSFEEAFVIGGDYNVGPFPLDVYDPAALDGTICYHPDERARMRALLNLGLYDAFRVVEPRARAYSWWDYQGRFFRANQGLRIDHLLLSPQATDRLETCGIDAGERAAKAPSDHVPVWCTLADS
ncbi:MAG TPA: exodeoxyribonuclease III [Geminicoccaceae bacterium]|nr:exodeoxyribonuclease III [Geminicoccaceae bacterium]